MRFLLILMVMAVAVVVGAWWVRPDASGSPWIVDRPPSEAGLEQLEWTIAGSARFIGFDFLGRGSRQSFREALARAVVAGRVLPVLALVTTSAVLAGLIVRESARFALRFSSPTLNYLGKRLAAASLVAGLTLPVLPACVPPWSLYVLGILFALGVGTYVANLPVKL